MKRRAGLFLDRDGTLVEDCGILKDQSQVNFLPGTVKALKRLQEKFLLFIVTNQPGVADGQLTLKDVNAVNSFILKYLADAGVFIQDVYVCPHRRDQGCICIKPKPYFIQQAAAKFGLDPGLSVVVGDHPHDIELGKAAGGCGIYVLTGHGRKHLHELNQESLVVPGLKEASDWIFALAQYDNQAQKLKDELSRAGDAIKRGQLVAFPTETVYGLGANAFDAQAVARVFEAKRRPRIDPLIVHIADISQADTLVEAFSPEARKLAESFWPGPLTMILKKNRTVPDIVTSGLPDVAIRMPDNQLALALIRLSGVPIAAPSANPFGYISPTTADHVRRQLGKEIEIVLDGGDCRVGVESTIVSFSDNKPAIMRHGGIPVEEIERIIGPLSGVRQLQATSIYPGQFPRHYSPRTPLVLLNQDEPLPGGSHVGLLSFGPYTQGISYAAIEILSQTRNLDEAAANLYRALHRLDALNLETIFAYLVPDEGLGVTINDRLRKASNQSKRNHQ